ncbi:hypothetical protein BDR26DRAFT_875367 [Obelidium mucronatum]|nr:hypothetical protein BDR26DRAFT_875367 [Obelidium mucronatum]
MVHRTATANRVQPAAGRKDTVVSIDAATAAAAADEEIARGLAHEAYGSLDAAFGGADGAILTRFFGARCVRFMYNEDRDLFDAMLAHANAHPEAIMVDTLNEFASRVDADIMAKIIYSVNPADFTQTLEKQWQKRFVIGFWVVWRWVKSGIKPAAAASQVCSCLQVIKKTCSGESGSTVCFIFFVCGVFATCFLESVAFWIKVNKEVATPKTPKRVDY